ncbi:hypothetical protein B0T21DRAFT_347409 [Apiosordaria backusii]|uniref:Uncharacterized protein n=1 Tax=Apiosordaria backusii TaxID=314023 RepID=A0AA40BMP6_9PEZI|nr:hypothetical protein B0T21DRAFT_347409 [Apiosordaria backusii]
MYAAEEFFSSSLGCLSVLSVAGGLLWTLMTPGVWWYYAGYFCVSDDSFDQFLGASACAWSSAESFKAAAESGDGQSWEKLSGVGQSSFTVGGCGAKMGERFEEQRSPVQFSDALSRQPGLRSSRAGLDLESPKSLAAAHKQKVDDEVNGIRPIRDRNRKDALGIILGASRHEQPAHDLHRDWVWWITDGSGCEIATCSSPNNPHQGPPSSTGGHADGYTRRRDRLARATGQKRDDDLPCDGTGGLYYYRAIKVSTPTNLVSTSFHDGTVPTGSSSSCVLNRLKHSRALAALPVISSLHHTSPLSIWAAYLYRALDRLLHPRVTPDASRSGNHSSYATFLCTSVDRGAGGRRPGIVPSSAG